MLAAAILNLDEGASAGRRLIAAIAFFRHCANAVGAGYFIQKECQGWLFMIADYQLHSGQLLKLFGHALGVAAGSHQEGFGVLAVSLPEQVAGLGIGRLGNRAGIQDIDIGFSHRIHQPVACLSQLAGQRLGLRLIELAA